MCPVGSRRHPVEAFASASPAPFGESSSQPSVLAGIAAGEIIGWRNHGLRVESASKWIPPSPGAVVDAPKFEVLMAVPVGAPRVIEFEKHRRRRGSMIRPETQARGDTVGSASSGEER